jgi:FlgN protein
MVEIMSINELKSVLEEQQQNLKEFVECAASKQKALVKNDLNELQKALLDEEKLLSKMETTGDKISSAIGELAEEYSLDLETNSISEFIKAVKYKSEVNVKVIKLLQNSIRDLISKAIYTNEQNKILIEHSRNFIRETILNLVALNNNQLLDRKI